MFHDVMLECNVLLYHKLPRLLYTHIIVVLYSQIL
eukprot:COSAG06_NODE_1411_length_9546_cov_8.730602_5_plen_35_part_00